MLADPAIATRTNYDSRSRGTTGRLFRTDPAGVLRVSPCRLGSLDRSQVQSLSRTPPTHGPGRPGRTQLHTRHVYMILVKLNMLGLSKIFIMTYNLG